MRRLNKKNLLIGTGLFLGLFFIFLLSQNSQKEIIPKSQSSHSSKEDKSLSNFEGKVESQPEIKESEKQSPSKALSQTIESLLAGDDSKLSDLKVADDFDRELEFKRTPLMVLAFNRNLEGVKILLERGASLSKVDESGGNALMNALNGNAPQVALEILKHKIDVNHLDHSGQSALHYAVGVGDKEVIAKLLELGADPNILANRADYTMLMDLCHEGLHDNVALFIKHGARLDVKDNEGRTPLHHAVLSGDKKTVELMLAAGVSKSEQDLKGKTALDLAHEFELAEIEKVLK